MEGVGRQVEDEGVVYEVSWSPAFEAECAKDRKLTPAVFRRQAHYTKDTILAALRLGPATIAELAAITGDSKTTINNCLYYLERVDLVAASHRQPLGRRRMSDPIRWSLR